MAAVSLTLSVCHDCNSAMRDCIGRLDGALVRLAQPEAFLERFPRLFDRAVAGAIGLRDDIGDMFLSGGSCGAAARAGHGLVSLQPSEFFAEFMAALAREIDVEVVEVHGWPVLSLVGRIANVTEAGGVCNLSGGGVSDGASTSLDTNGPVVLGLDLAGGDDCTAVGVACGGQILGVVALERGENLDSPPFRARLANLVEANEQSNGGGQ